MTDPSTEQLNKRISKTKIKLMASKATAFFVTIAFRMIWEITDMVPTAATNGKYLYLNPDFIKDLTDAELLGLAMHEIMHVAYMHMIRGSKLQQHRYNAAADYVINLNLKDWGFTLPEGGLLDEQYRDLSTKEVYDLLDPNMELRIDLQDIIIAGKEDYTDMEKEVLDIVSMAITADRVQHSTAGSIPAEILAKYEELTNPVLNWDAILLRYFTERTKTDYTWRRLNRKYMPNYYLPTLYSESMGPLAIAIDVSASVSDSDLAKFMSEIKYIQETIKPEKTSVFGFDTKINKVTELDQGDDIKGIQLTGRGGTYIDPVISWINKHNPQVTLIFTDGYFSIPDELPESDVIWLIYSNPSFTHPVGEVIHFTPQDL